MSKDTPSKSEPTGHIGYLKKDGQLDDVTFWEDFFGADDVAPGDNPLEALDGLAPDEPQDPSV